MRNSGQITDERDKEEAEKNKRDTREMWDKKRIALCHRVVVSSSRRVHLVVEQLESELLRMFGFEHSANISRRDFRGGKEGKPVVMMMLQSAVKLFQVGTSM